MINLLQGIVDRLSELFPNKNIYANDIEQGLIEPCFFFFFVDDLLIRMVSVVNQRGGSVSSLLK